MAKKYRPVQSPATKATQGVKQAIEELCALKIPIETYIAALEEIEVYVEASLDAAREDVARAERIGRDG